MNAVLRRILDSRVVGNGESSSPLHSNIQPEEGQLLHDVIASVKPSTTLEIGMAYGVSTLFICDALATLDKAVKHIVIDPRQSQDWQGIGMAHVREAGYADIVELHEEGSEFALPRLLRQGTQIDVAFIDGWHTFDHALIDFFYVNRMLSVGGVVVFDDVNYESIHRLVRHVLTYPAYRFLATARSWTPTDGLLGRARRTLAQTALAKAVLHPGLLARPWDEGWGECVALQKIAPDDRSFDWWAEF